MNITLKAMLTPSPITSSTTPYPSGLTGGLGGSISVEASPLPQTGGTRHKTHSDPLSPHKRHAPCLLATQLPSAYHRTHFGPLLDRLVRLLSRSRTRKRLQSIHKLRSSSLSSAGGNKHSRCKPALNSSYFLSCFGDYTGENAHRVRSGNLWRHAPQPGHIRLLSTTGPFRWIGTSASQPIPPLRPSIPHSRLICH